MGFFNKLAYNLFMAEQEHKLPPINSTRQLLLDKTVDRFVTYAKSGIDINDPSRQKEVFDFTGIVLNELTLSELEYLRTNVNTKLKKLGIYLHI